ncbi:hypothetical protein [Streptomyces puniciscabiei]|uniref:hypothetical protein n=1 Tax=Streptomyces puniciscabiei TaxID=164348 RepID=UPI0037AC8985
MLVGQCRGRSPDPGLLGQDAYPAAGQVRLLDLAPAMTVGAQLALGSLLHAQSDLDDARSTDLVVRGPLRHFGLSADEAERICSPDLPDLGLVDAAVL